MGHSFLVLGASRRSRSFAALGASLCVFVFFWIRQLLGLLCSSGFPRVYSSFYSSLLVLPFIFAVAVICSFTHSGCFVRLVRKNSFEHCPSPRPAGTTSTHFLQLDGRAVLSTVRHLAQLARLPSSFLSSLTLRHPGGRVREFRRGRSTQLDTKGLVSIVRSIRLLFVGTRYWVLEYLLADASDFAITSGPW